MFSLQVVYATVLYCIFQFLKAFSRMPMVEAGDYQIAALYWYPITAFELVKNYMDDDWDYVAPLFAAIHHIYMVFVCCFIGLSMACGLMIHNHLSTWKMPYLRWFRSAATSMATIFIGVFRIMGCVCAAGESFLARCLDLLLTDNPFWLLVSSTGLLLGDILLAVWTANLFSPTGSRYQFDTATESRNASSSQPRGGTVVTWHFGNPDVPGYGAEVVELIRKSLQSCPARIAHWYNSQHELDEIHHYPALSGTIMLMVLCVGFKWILEDKPQQLRQVEHTIEETLRKNAITHDFEDYLRQRSIRTDSCKAFMVSNLKVIRDLVARNMTLMNQYRFATAQVDRLQASLTGRAQQIDMYTRENVEICRVNTKLQNELNRQRASADVHNYTASIEALNTQLASANNDNIDLQQQRDQLYQELLATRESRAYAETRATAAEVVRAERSSLRADVTRLAQQNEGLKQNLIEQQSALEREKAAAEAATNTASEIRLRNTAMAAHIQSLQARLEMQEARSEEIISATETNVNTLQAEIIALRSNQDSRNRDLEHSLIREEQTRTVLKDRETQMRKTRRVKQKQASNLLIRCHDAVRTAYAYKERNNVLERLLVESDPTLQDSMQTIHDPRKSDHVGQLRRQLDDQRARSRVLEHNIKAHQETINQLEKQLAGQQSAAMTGSRADADTIVRMGNELRRLEAENQQLRIRISNLEAQQAGPRSGDPFIRKHSRGGRGARRG